jgi:hypothetical protein
MSAPATPRRAAPLGLVGRDLAADPHGRRTGSRAVLGVVVAAAVLAGLAVVAVRNGQIRMRYELTEAMQQERELLQQRRALTARVLALRDPDRLARLARERGFVRPVHVHELPAPQDPRR